MFKASEIEIWQVPRNVYRQLNISHAALVAGLKPAGGLGRYLLDQIERVIASTGSELGETDRQCRATKRARLARRSV